LTDVVAALVEVDEASNYRTLPSFHFPRQDNIVKGSSWPTDQNEEFGEDFLRYKASPILMPRFMDVPSAELVEYYKGVFGEMPSRYDGYTDILGNNEILVLLAAAFTLSVSRYFASHPWYQK
ncbi:hypothetical protein Tco_0681845, partial [Tanacetum coccineum]